MKSHEDLEKALKHLAHSRDGDRTDAFPGESRGS